MRNIFRSVMLVEHIADDDSDFQPV